MDGCTDDRSLTPPLPKNLIASNFGENGKQIISSLYDKDDQVDINRSTPMSAIANKLGLCNYNSTSEDDDEINESNSKTTSNRCESTKSTVINAKNRKSEERDRINRRNRRGSRDSSPRRKIKDWKNHRSSSKHRPDEYHNRRRRSSSKGKTRFHSPRDMPKIPPKPRGEIRRTVTEPIIEYCDNGRHSNIKTKVVEPRQKLRRMNDAGAVNVVKTYEETEEEQPQAVNNATNQSSNTPNRVKIDLNEISATVELAISSNRANQLIEDSPKQALERQETQEKEEVQIKTEDLAHDEECHTNQDDVKGEPSPKKQLEDKFVVKSPVEMASPSKNGDNMDVTSTTPEHSISVKLERHDKREEKKPLSNEDKLKQYIDEYEFFIQQVSSPVNVPNTNPQLNVSSVKSSPLIDIFATASPKNNRKTPSPKNNRKKSSSPSSSSSSSSSDDDSSSSSSSSSSDDDSDSSSDSSSSSESDKSASDSSSSRSTSKSPRPLKSVNSNCGLDRLNFTVSNDEQSRNGPQAILESPFTLPKGNINISVNTLKSLDDLINFDDDDDDLLSSLQSYKDHMRKLKVAKEAAEKSKLDGAAPNENRTNDTLQNLENGALLHESERKKVSMKLKSTSALKSQTNELNEPFVDNEHQELNKTVNDKQAIEQNDQSEKSSNEKSMATKKKSSYRKDERKSRRSEDRKSSRCSEERSRSKRSEDRRSRRSEEKHSKRSEERRSKRSEEHHSRRSEERRSRRSEEKRHRRSEERRQKRRRQSPVSPNHYHDSYYSPKYRNHTLSPMPRGPRTPPNTPPPNQTEFDEMAMRHMPYSTTVMPPSAHYQPDPNQFPTPNLPSNVPNYVNEYAAYMHPNRMPVLQYNRPPPSIHTSPGMPTLGPNNEYYYQNSPSHAPPHHLTNQSIPPNSFSNLIEVSPYGVPNTNVDCMRKPPDNRRKPTNAVQKGNVLEIVPSAEILCDRNIDSADTDKSDKVHLIEKQHQQALQRQKQERLKRKMERHQKRLDRSKRKEFLLAELNRLSHLMIFGEDGKIVKAGEILKSIVYDGTTIKLANSKELDDDEEMEEIFTEPPIFSYDPQAAVGRSILSDRNEAEKTLNVKDSSTLKRRGVLFADGIAPGDGTSASENSETEADDSIIKPKKLSTRAKNKKDQKINTILPPLSSEPIPMFLDKENSLEAKFNVRESDQQQMVPPAPPGSPPPQLPQPKLKDPEKLATNHLLYFHYDGRSNKMIITPLNSRFDTPPHMMPPIMMPVMIPQPPQMMKTNHIMPLVMEPTPPPGQPPYIYKSNNVRHHTDTKSVSKPKSSSTKGYHSSAHKSLHPNSEANNLIVLSSSPNA